MLSRDSLEKDWQRFFAEHPYVLSMSLPLRLEPTDIIPLARPGRNEPDFVFYPRDLQPLPFYGAIEIKRPSTSIISTPRANTVILSRAAETAIP